MLNDMKLAIKKRYSIKCTGEETNVPLQVRVDHETGTSAFNEFQAFLKLSLGKDSDRYISSAISLSF